MSEGGKERESKKGRRNGWMMDEWMFGWINGWTDGCMDDMMDSG